MFLQVVRRADPVDHGKQAGCVQGRQDAVPSAAVQIDALGTIGQKGARLARRAAEVRGDDDQKRVFGHWQKGLGAVGVPFDQIKGIGQRARLGLKDRNAGAGVAPDPEAHVDAGAVVVALALALIDQPKIAGGVQHVAEGGEAGGGEGVCGDLHEVPLASAGGFTPPEMVWFGEPTIFPRGIFVNR